MGKKRKVLVLILMILLVAIIALPIIGCGDNGSNEEKKIKISFVLQNAYMDFFVPCMVGAKDCAKEYGVELNWIGPDTPDINKQLSIIETELERGIDGLVIQAGDAEQLRTILDRAKELGVPVINTNNAIKYEGVAIDGYVGHDPRTAGEMLAKGLIDVLNGEGPWAEKYNYKLDSFDNVKVAYLINIPGSPNLEYRIEGAKNYLSENYPEITDIGKYDTTTSIPTAKGIVDNIITGNPDLTAFICTGSTPTVAAGSAVNDRGLNGKIVVVGQDELPETIELIRGGSTAFVLGQQRYYQGYMPVKFLIENILDGKEIPEFWYPEFEIVNMNNCDEVEERENKFLGK